MKSDNVELRSEADSTLFATNPLIRFGFASTTESSADDDSPTESSADLLLPLRVRVVQMIIIFASTTESCASTTESCADDHHRQKLPNVAHRQK